jgi:thiol:disulfide interchange protein DsbD
MKHFKIKILTGVLVAIALSTGVFAQVIQPVKWSYSTEKVNDKEYNLVFKAKIDKGWHLYSQFFTRRKFLVANKI